MIEKLDLRVDEKSMPIMLAWELLENKINEIIDKLNGPEERVLVCPHCNSSEDWDSGYSRTLMGGSMNVYTYYCKKCEQCTKVRRYSGKRDRRILLGPEDEIKE